MKGDERDGVESRKAQGRGVQLPPLYAIRDKKVKSQIEWWEYSPTFFPT